jgi:hypothetical protein
LVDVDFLRKTSLIALGASGLYCIGTVGYWNLQLLGTGAAKTQFFLLVHTYLKQVGDELEWWANLDKTSEANSSTVAVSTGKAFIENEFLNNSQMFGLTSFDLPGLRNLYEIPNISDEVVREIFRSNLPILLNSGEKKVKIIINEIIAKNPEISASKVKVVLDTVEITAKIVDVTNGTGIN